MSNRVLSGLLLLGSISVALALAEVSVRIFAPYSRDQVVPAGMFTMDPDLGWKLNPGRNVRHRTRSFDIGYTINAMGFRDRPRTLANSMNKRRILLFGDSQIFGWGIRENQRISDVIEAQDSSTEVFNMAVPGYGLDQEVISYERDGGSLGATDVILFVSTFTINRTRTGFIFRKHKPMFVVDSTRELVLVPPMKGASARTDVVYRILSPFHLPYFVDGQLRRIRRLYTPRNPGRDPTAPVSAQHLRLTEALLLRAKAVADRRNQRLIVLAILPPPSMQSLKQFAATNGIVMVPAPWTVAPPALVLGKYDEHWNPRGHAVVARQLLPEISQSK